MAEDRKPRCIPRKTEGPSKYSFFYLCVDAPDGITILEENLFFFMFMFSRLTNRCVLSSLSAAALTLGLFSCGGSGSSGDGESLPSGAMLDLTASLSTEGGVGPWNIVVKLTGNGGTFTGSITYQVPVLNDEGVEEAQDWTATEGTVSYTVS